MKNNGCDESSKLWMLIYKIQKIRGQKLVLTSEQRFQLCNYVNGRPYNKVVLQSFI